MLNLQIPDSLIESMSPSEIGAYIRGLREQFGLSLQDVSDRIRVRVRYLEAIESAAVHMLPARVYARGYMQCYAEFLGLDPKKATEVFFGTDLRDDTAPAPVASAPTSMNAAHWRGVAILLGVATMIALIGAQVYAHRDSKSVEAVPEVPEEMLVATRTIMMPTVANYACFSAPDDWMACWQSSREWQVVTTEDILAITAPLLPEIVTEEPTTEAQEDTIPEEPSSIEEDRQKKPVPPKPKKRVDHESSTDGDGEHHVDHNAEW